MKKQIIGMIHLSGDESIRHNRALQELMIYEDEGLYGCIIENYHGSIDDVRVFLGMIETRSNNIKIGINILPNEYAIAFKLANEFDIDFIQLDYVSGTYNRSSHIDKENYVEHYLTLPPHVKVYGGVWPKYYEPIKGSNLKKDISDGLFLSDAIVVTGSGTGKETPLDKVKEFKNIITNTKKFQNTPLIVGAGLDVTNVKEQLAIADGAIVGSCFKPYKRTQEMISRELVREFMSEVNKIQ